MTCTASQPCHCVDRLLSVAERLERQASDCAARGYPAEQAALNLAAAMLRANVPTHEVTS